MKFFHVATKKDDPDADKRTGAGEKAQRGTQASRETQDFQRRALSQMLSELYAGDEEKIRAGLVAITKSDKRGFAGVDSVDRLSPAALPVTYAKVKKAYESRTGHAFEFKEGDADANG